jgi:ABC-type oligopeptide transport system substrate-binding subunit
MNSMRLSWLFVAILLVGCSASSSSNKQTKAEPAVPAHFTASNTSNPIAKYGDPPLITFPAQVSRLGPSELKDVKVEVPTSLRVYELPDWQFLKADLEIAAPTE